MMLMTRKRIVIVAFAALAGLALTMAVISGVRLLETRSTNPLTPDRGMDALSIPAFTLTDHTGDSVTRDALTGRVTVLNFFFTHCQSVCPPMQRNMREAQRRLSDSSVRFMSVSVDPKRDTPKRLREYASQLNAELDAWTFATGEEQTIERIIRDGLLLAKPQKSPQQTIPLPDGGEMNNILHPSRLALIGPDAQVLALYNGLDREDVARLVERALAAAEALKQHS